MQTVGVILVLINVLTLAAPFAYVAITYQNDISDVVVPPQITQIMDETFPSGLEFKLPAFVDASVDDENRTVSLTVNFTNPLNYNLTLKEVSTDIICREHNVTLGHADVTGPMFITAAESVQVNIVCTWTQEAEEHFLAEHAEDTSIKVNMTNSVVNINEITLELPETYECPVDLPLTCDW